MANKILVTGATGELGKATIEFLIKKGVEAGTVSALVRDRAKATDFEAKGVVLKVADYNDREKLVEAFRGVDRLLFVSSNDIPNRLAQHKNVIDAAKEAGVGHVFYTSFEKKEDGGPSSVDFIEEAHVETERLLSESGLSHSNLRNTLYTDMLPLFWGDKVLETGVYFPAGEGRAAYVSRLDMAEANANLLLSEGTLKPFYYFSASKAVTMQEAVNALNAATGKEIAYISPDAGEYRSTLAKGGVPDLYIAMFAGFAEAIKQGEFSRETGDLEEILGRPLTSLEDVFRSIYQTGNAAAA